MISFSCVPLHCSHLGSGSLLLLVGKLLRGVSKISCTLCAPEAHAAGVEVLKLLSASPGCWEAPSVTATVNWEPRSVFLPDVPHTRHQWTDPAELSSVNESLPQ